MNIESNRLNTFTNWPTSAPVDPPRLARGGFFYTGEGTEVQCFSCNIKISQWNYGDQVMWRHRLTQPNCTFVERPTLSGNVSIESGAECDIPDTSDLSEVEGEGTTEPVSATGDYGLTDEDEMYKSDALRLLSFISWDDASVSREALVNAGFYHAGGGRLRCAWCGGELAPFTTLGSLGSPIEIHRMYFPRCDHAAAIMAAFQSSNVSLPSSPLSDTPPIRSPVLNDNEPQSSGAAHNTRILNALTAWRSLGVVSGGARHPSHSSLSARLATFERWPADRTQSPQALAEAGFYHTGTDDQVRCFYCDGGLGKWEAGDTPWLEHARWFPNCGYVLIVKGQEFVDSCKLKPPAQRNSSNENGVALNGSNPTNNLPVTEERISECLESAVGLGALAAGLDAARVRRAISKRLRITGTPFTTSESLIDAVLDEQLNEESWSVSTNSHRFARDILAETLREFAPTSRVYPSASASASRAGRSSRSRTRTRTRSPSPSTASPPPPPPPRRPLTAGHTRSAAQNRSSRSTSRSSHSHSNSPSQNRTPAQNTPQETNGRQESEKRDSDSEQPTTTKTADRTLSLEEENRQLKESRMCKVCMDSEVSVVFLPCGHLVSCARCGAALCACPLCRAPVRALVRAYLA